MDEIDDLIARLNTTRHFGEISIVSGVSRATIDRLISGRHMPGIVKFLAISKAERVVAENIARLESARLALIAEGVVVKRPGKRDAVREPATGLS